MTGKRMHVHDYTRVGFYMITILTADRRRLFGACTDGRTRLSEAGEIVRRHWQEIPAHRPAVETNTLVVMPDHIHGIVYVKEPLPKPVGQTIRGFKSGVTSELRRHFGNAALGCGDLQPSRAHPHRRGWGSRASERPQALHSEPRAGQNHA